MTNTQKRHLYKIPSALLAVGLCMLAVALLAGSRYVSEGIRSGLIVCANVLIPSLFPFMVFSGFLTHTKYARLLSRPLRFLTTHLFRLPEDLGVVVLLSLVGGFPVGAKSISTLMARKKIDAATASRMLCFCVNSGPSFLITAVGVGMLRDKSLGLLLFGAQTIATILVGAIVSVGAKPPKKETTTSSDMSVAAGFVTAVGSGASAMMAMCAFAILFSGVLSLLASFGFPLWLAQRIPFLSADVITALLSGFFEVTAGCLKSTQLEGLAGFLLTSVFVSFGGLSVIFQIISCFEPGTVRFAPYLLSRFLHAAIACGVALPFYSKLQQTMTTSASIQPPLMETSSQTAIITLCLICMSTILILSLWHGRTESGFARPATQWKRKLAKLRR